MDTNYLAIAPNGVAYRVVRAEPTKPDAAAECIPLCASRERVDIPYRDLRPLRTEMDACLALEAARTAKNYDAAKSCEQAVELMRLVAKGFIPGWSIAMTLADVFARDEARRLQEARAREQE